MPQVSLYLDRVLYKEVKGAAERKGTSLSSYVSEILKNHLDDEWPEAFFNALGSIDDDDFVEPYDPPVPINEKRLMF